MNHHGHYNNAADVTTSRPFDIMAQSQGGQSITILTHRDVLNGRGQGVQRHPGNVKYRKLVFVNKGLYARCPKTGSDKMKISKGIVSAVRALGGRFLELDERTGIYSDIGDKRAIEKTSQALREGLSKFRRENSLSTLPSGRLPNTISAEGYFAYSVHVLETLHGGEENDNNVSPVVDSHVPEEILSSTAFAHADKDVKASTVLSSSVDQFPDTSQESNPSHIQTKQSVALPASAENSVNTSDPIHPSLASIGQFLSMTSIRSTIDSAASEKPPAAREDAVGQEVDALLRLSEPQLLQVENRNIDERAEHEESKEVDLFGESVNHNSDEEMMIMRFTDLELMRSTLMSIPADEMSRSSEDTNENK